MLKTVAKAGMLGFAALLPLYGATSLAPALAHHGWNSFDTRYAYFIRGSVSDVSWGNPHSEVTLRVTGTALPQGLGERPLPPGADADIAAATLASARPYEGEHEEIHLTLAGPGWMSRWGLDRPLEEGETVEVLGYIGSADSDDLRPAMFWLADGQGVWQQLTSFPTAPVPASQD